MSKFSIYLEEIIRKSGEPISRIAKNAGLERTSIHKALKDERILPYSSLQKLAQYFQLTLSETKELNLYYNILLQGEETYCTQNEILQMFSDLNHLNFAPLNYHVPLSNEATLSSCMIHGKAEVEYVIQAILQKETETSGISIDFYLDEDNPFADTLVRLWRCSKQFTVNQIISFLPSNSRTNNDQQNIRVIRKILPTALLSNSQYFTYYCYTSNAMSGSLYPFPYFIIAPNHLISINQDYSVAYIHTDDSLIQFYRKQFNQIKSDCQPLISYSDNWADILSSYMDNTDTTGYFTMMSQPCMGRFYTREIIEKYIRPELPYRRQLIEMGVKRFSVLANQNTNYYTVFSKSGIEQFIHDGVIADLPSEQVLPLAPSDRLLLLTQLREDISSDRVNGYMVDSDQFLIPQYLTFTCDPHFGLHVYAINDFVGGSYSCNLHITTANIGKIFCDFIKFLPNSKYVYSKEETLDILEQYIDILKQKT